MITADKALSILIHSSWIMHSATLCPDLEGFGEITLEIWKETWSFEPFSGLLQFQSWCYIMVASKCAEFKCHAASFSATAKNFRMQRQSSTWYVIWVKFKISSTELVDQSKWVRIGRKCCEENYCWPDNLQIDCQSCGCPFWLVRI